MRPDDPTLSAESITAKSGSNLALSFVCLSKERRRDMTVFYAFCRVIDDIADEKNISSADRKTLLDAWRACVTGGTEHGDGLGPEVNRLILKYAISREHFAAIIDGCEMDLGIKRYPHFADLLKYCYRVASAVGLVSIEVFGYQSPSTRDYAIQLGYALQLTNILRDVATDLRNDGRIYLPLDELERFGYAESELTSETYNEEFVRLMDFQADRAESFYATALSHLDPADRRNMIAAEMMRAVYWKILQRLRKDRYRVFEREYRLNKFQKAVTLLQAWSSMTRTPAAA